MITARYHREIPQRYRLEAAKCSSCGHVSFPPRLVCPQCKARKFEAVNLSDEGTIVTFTVVRVASDKFSKETPFGVGIVELNDGVRVTAQIADVHPDELKVGQKVKLVFRRVQEDGKAGILCYGYKAVLA
ncbi:MAG: Zn-ribbon domain-containing OB-fold protein [Ignavibacteriae bacterium]|nr:Zn-ribbon domain-containing OB-fold protein [Ignavibacteriota bacterium]